MADAETSGTILSRTNQLMRGNARAAAIGVIGLSIADMIIDRLPTQSFALTGVASLAAQYVLIAAALRRLGLIGDGEGAARLPAMFGLLLLTNLAILVGVVLLIVPGVILALRWSIAVPILLAERTTIRDAMRQSWERTAGRFWPIFGVFALYTVVLVAAAGAGVLFEGNVAGTILANVVVNIVVVAGWYADIAIYEHGRPRTRELEEVFA